MTNRQKEINTAWHPLADGNPPSWASGWGQDDFGVFVEFTLNHQDGPVIQRMRWIPPGLFSMGSPPEDEPGRYDREGPPHQVTISQGYWLFDTPVTQALWLAVMGNNPSKFRSPERPVEQVSWDDCQLFLEKINKSIPGLNLSLPSEAQWEYSCRAGGEGAIYTGGLEIVGDGNAPALDAIAWYGGNSGEGFELELDKGQNISYLQDRQYDSNPCGSHPVAMKQPNSWGLYDMLGNVWEWCLDGRRDYTEKNVYDPLGSVGPGAERVIRGGSWSNKARYCRCASRYWYHPDSRNDNLGFRCARVQV